jgi:homoserine dehydrogenase
MQIRLVLAGLGNVGRNFLRLMAFQRDLLCDVYDLDLVLIGAADSRHIIAHPDGIDPTELLNAKERRVDLSSLVETRRGASLRHINDLVESTDADLLLEATPANFQHAQPGLDLVRAALRKGMGVVLANKGPLALAFAELNELGAGRSPLMAHSGHKPPALSPSGRGSRMRFSACVGGALPTINIGVRDLAGARITRVEAAVNGTCQGIVRMMERGVSFDDALAEMQRRGVVEADPSLDIDGWDEAAKLVIIANAVLRQPTTIRDLSVQGIRHFTQKDLREAKARGERITLLGLAEWNGERYDLSVRPVALPFDHPISRMGDDEMGVVYQTDVSGRISAFAEEISAMPTAAAMLRDVIEIASSLFPLP